MPTAPVNGPHWTSDPQVIAADVNVALRIADQYVGMVPGGAARLIHRHVLELDPEASLGPAVLLACHGAQVSVASSHPRPWNAAYHGAFYKALYARLASDRPWLSPDPIRALLLDDSFAADTLRCIETDIEQLAGVEDDHFDLVFSHKLLGRVENVPGSLASLARVTRAGGHGIHLVDFRDQRDTGRPLEHLTIAADAFQVASAGPNGGCGNRWRPGAMQLEAERSGFEVADLRNEVHADDAYIDDLLPRIHSDYAGLDHETLRVLAGDFLMRRRVHLNTEYPLETDAPQTLSHSLCRYDYCLPFVPGKRVLDLGCGAGLGTRTLIAAGAASVTGIDVRPEALAVARAADTHARPEAWLEHDLDRVLPLPDDSVDVVVALEVLEHIHNQQQLIDEIRRVLTPDGVAFISIPHRPFELFWTRLAGETNPYHLYVPEQQEFEAMLGGFQSFELAVQVDLVASLVLPLDGTATESADELVLPQGTLTGLSRMPLSENGSIVLIAKAHNGATPDSGGAAPAARAWGNHQQSFGDAIQHNQDLERHIDDLISDRNAARNQLRWIELGELDPSQLREL
jgi:SAM-dependent methyltransferase